MDFHVPMIAFTVTSIMCKRVPLCRALRNLIDDKAPDITDQKLCDVVKNFCPLGSPE